MITLGTIVSIDDTSNFCKVRLPTLEGTGNMTSTILSATQMLPPGVDAGYEVGDVVFVSFVDNSLGRPVVLGQLYKGPGKGTKVDGIGSNSDVSLGLAKSMACKNLTVQDTAIIPAGTVMTSSNDQIDGQTLTSLFDRVKALEIAVLGLCAGGTSFAFSNPVFAAACVAAGGYLGASLVLDEVEEKKEDSSDKE